MPVEPAAPDKACDIVVFAAHPDDAELCCGGLLLVSAARGRTTAVVDLTRGELGSRGTPEIRQAEASRASEVLKLTTRLNLGLPDGGLRDTDDNRRAVVEVVRRLRPKLVVAPPLADHHPDHVAVAELVRNSFYLCGIAKYPPREVSPWRPRGLLHHMGTRPMQPDLVVDVSDVIEERMRAVRCYESQFGGSQGEGFPLRIAAARFVDSIEKTLAYFGSLIGVAHGEPYTSETPLPAPDPAALFEAEPWKDR